MLSLTSLIFLRFTLTLYGGCSCWLTWRSTDLGPVHTMPDKFENATLMLWLGLPSTLIRLYPHKKIHENGTFWKRFPERNCLKTILFCISVDGELFVSVTFRIRWRHFVMWFVFPRTSTWRRTRYFLCCWQYSSWSSLIAYFELNIALIRQRTRNDFTRG